MYTLVVAVCLLTPVPEGTQYQCRAERIDRLSNTVCEDMKNMALARVTENTSVAAECIQTGVAGSTPQIKS